jgi:MtrB/PioB family decaheme-associated outer membrane protein
MASQRIRAVARPALALLLLAGAPPAAVNAEEMVFHVEPVTLEILETSLDSDLDTFQFREDPGRVESAKFSEYRDLRSGFRLRELHITGDAPDSDRYFDFRGTNVGRADARYGLQYGSWGDWELEVDYNKIVHRFGNEALFLWNVTGPGRFEIADPAQAQIQGAIERQRALSPAGVNFAFLRGLLAPYLEAASTLDIGLRRDRTDLSFELGRMGPLAWSANIQHENRNGTRPYGGSFGFSNAPEIVEPIDYDTSTAELKGEWNGAGAGVQFGYRYSQFENNISTLIWDNPFRVSDATDPNAYSAPGSGSIGGAALGFADLAPSNDASLAFVDGRARFGGNWHANGRASYQILSQDDPLLPYTLNTAIVGEGFGGAHFDPTNPANLPASRADNEVKVLNLSADVGSRFADRFDLAFRYRYYDYDNQSRRISFPGYVRFHAVWEEIGRITVPYSYTRETASVELGWEVTDTSELQLSYELRSWDRTFREVESSDESAVKLSFDTRAIPNLVLRSSYEIGDRSIDGYDTAAMENSFIVHGEPANHPGMRKFLQAAREYGEWSVMAMYLAGDSLSLTATTSGRQEDYDESPLGLQSADKLGFGLELGWALREGVSANLFANRESIDYFLRSRQSGATASVREIDDWTGDFEDTTDTLGLGLSCDECGKWNAEFAASWSRTEGSLDLFSPPGGTPDVAFDITNYDDVTFFSVDAEVDYRLSEHVSAGLSWLWEDYDIDSFLTRGLVPYLPSAPLLDLVNGGYTANVVGLHLKLVI